MTVEIRRRSSVREAEIHTNPVVVEEAFVSRFLEHATRLMEAAEEAVQAGHGVSDVTVLIHQGGGLHLLMKNDWPLDSLIQDRGADLAYREIGRAHV